jgi:Domain of unknown function (DUF4166)
MRVMGDTWAQIAEPIRHAHTTHSIARARGHLRVDHGRHYLARWLARVLRLPRPSAAADTRLIVTARPDGERWQRTFDGRRLETRQYESNEGDLAERFGVLEFRFRLDAPGGSLVYFQREAALRFGFARIRIPASWAPRVEAREDPAGPTRINVNVRIVLPWVGPLISYAGTIDVEDTHP